MRRTVAPWLACLFVAIAAPAGASSCPSEAVVAVVVDNASADPAVDVTVSGTRIASTGACDATGTELVDTYATTLHCEGSGPTRCGHVRGLAPGTWIHRITLQVGGSAQQLQAQRGVALAGAGVSNVVEWTAFGRTFVVAATDALSTGNVVAQLDAARAYTAANPSPALVRFSRAVFPAGTTTMIPLQTSPSCALTTCNGRETAYCLDGARVTVDALDDDGLPGSVGLSVGSCDNSLLRIYGVDNVLRGLVLEGYRRVPAVPQMGDKAVDTVAIAGLASGGNRLEQCTVIGPILGDGISVEGESSQAGAGTAPENTIAETEVRDAEDKGIKVDFGGTARIERTCIHDNDQGGVQATIGGTVTAIENVVQHNLGDHGGPQHGLIAGVPDPTHSIYPNALMTMGNVVRFNGARGVSVVDNALAILESDVVTENYRAGMKIETVVAAVTPKATVRGSLFAANYASGGCLITGEPCWQNADCQLMVCTPDTPLVSGVGLQAEQPAADCVGCNTPMIDLGKVGDAGRNAFTLNDNPNPLAAAGTNLRSTLQAGSPVPVRDDQWEHCDPPDAGSPTRCNLAQVLAQDVVVGPGATAIDLGTPWDPGQGPVPVLRAISPARARAGQFVRVYADPSGGEFDAIGGTARHPVALPADPCSPENPATVAKNASQPIARNRVMVTMDGVTYEAPVHQVTPSMLIFAMPVDCDEPGTLTVMRGADVVASIAVCEASGCAERPVGALCDDDDVCTIGETCQPDGTCGGATPLDCAGPCRTGSCDPQAGCVLQPVSAACDDGDACTAGDHCNGTQATCVPGPPIACVGVCLTGACDVAVGCVVRDDSATCDDGNACTSGDHCSGAADTCVGSPTACADANPCTADGCDTSTGCTHSPMADLSGVVCHLTQLRTLIASAQPEPPDLAQAMAARVACVERRVMKAEAAPSASAARRRQASRAVRCVRELVRRARHGGRLSDVTRDALVAEGDATRSAVADYFGL